MKELSFDDETECNNNKAIKIRKEASKKMNNFAILVMN